MNADFLDAHERHWLDAELLFDKDRLANADHLYGLSAECGLKSLMKIFGMPTQNDGNPSEQKNKVHADKVWERYQTYAKGHPGSRYSLVPQGNPFKDWHISQRYTNCSSFNKSLVDPHRKGVKSVRSLIMKARKEGLV